MLTDNVLVWNVRGLNSRARWMVVKELVAQERFTLVALQETKLENCDHSLVLEMLGTGFDFLHVPARRPHTPVAVSCLLGTLIAGRSQTRTSIAHP